MSVVIHGRPIEVLHLELTSRCNLACSGCMRTFNPLNHTDALKQDLDWDRLVALIDPYELSQLKHVYACGNLGDPIASKAVMDIFTQLTRLNPTMQQTIHTNGSLRNASWWEAFATVLAKHHRVVFAIDGLEDTNAIYRKGSDWSKVMENAKAFINAGGLAEWHFIVFEHNQHQIDQAKALSETLGFKAFKALQSERDDTFTKELKHHKTKPTEVPTTEVVCGALEKREIYLSAQGKFYPCCYLAIDNFIEPYSNWEVDFTNPRAVNGVVNNPTLKTCQAKCSRVKGKDLWARQFI